MRFAQVESSSQVEFATCESSGIYDILKFLSFGLDIVIYHIS